MAVVFETNDNKKWTKLLLLKLPKLKVSKQKWVQ